MYKYIVLMICLTFLSGCVKHNMAGEFQKESINNKTTQVLPGGRVRFEQCKSELKALRAFNLQSYTRQKKLLETSINKIAKYSLMKPGLSVDMQQIMDTVYEAQLLRHCQEIHSELFRLMLAHADKQP